jgi:hypothetical protein
MSEHPIKVVTTGQLLSAARVARHHEFALQLSANLVDRLDPLGHHSLGVTIADHGDRAVRGVPYYRCRALLALAQRLEPVEALVDVPAEDWAGWSSGDDVIAALKAAIESAGGVR